MSGSVVEECSGNVNFRLLAAEGVLVPMKGIEGSVTVRDCW